MIIKIEGGNKFFFPDNIEPQERLVEVNKMLNTVLDFDGRSMTVEDYFYETFNITGTRTNLEKISFYLSKMPNQKGKHDKEVLSRNDELEMNKGVRWTTKDGKRVLTKSMYKNYSDLSKEDKVSLGLDDMDDYNNNK